MSHSTGAAEPLGVACTIRETVEAWDIVDDMAYAFVVLSGGSDCTAT